MRVLLFTGKGGVGKTSLALATALGAAAHGHRTCVLSTDPAHSLGDALGAPVGARAREVAPGVVAREVSVLAELESGWAPIQDWLRGLLRAGAEELAAEELLVFPGLEELLALRAVREVEALGDFDTCVVDCAPTGATLRMLRFPDLLRTFMDRFFDWKRRGARWLRPWVEPVAEGLVPGEEVFDAFERLAREVDDVRQILLDGDRTSARLVVNPARVVVAEARRSFAYLSLYGVATDAVIVNRVLPPGAREGFFARWAAREESELAAVRASFPVPLLHAPLRAHEPVGADALGALAAEVYGDADPAAVLHRERPVRLERRGGRLRLRIALPGVTREEVSVAARGGDLFVRVRDAERVLALPDAVRGLRVAGARLQRGVLEVGFAP